MIRLKRGLSRWLASTNHKDIGTLYFIFGLFSGFVGRIFRLLIRTELRIPGPTFLSERAYNVIITAHGLIIIFFFLCTIIIFNLYLNNLNFLNIFKNFNILIIFPFLIFVSTAGWMYFFDLYLLIIDTGFGGGPSGRGGGSQFNFNNPTQPPKGDPSRVRGLLKDEKMKENLSELKENLDKENKERENKENINRRDTSKLLRRERKEDTISSSSSSSSDKRRKHGSQERLLKDKTNKKKWKCNIA